jgi:hypothetical protein
VLNDQGCPEDLAVDVATRTVRHKAGAIVTFYQHPSESEWVSANVGIIQNPGLFEGSRTELFRAAKEAASIAGMKHRKP